MKKTSVGQLLAVAAFVAALAWIATWRFYGSMTTVPWTVSITLWAAAALCVFLAQKVKARKEDGRIGLDRSQLNPVTAAQFMVVGKASAWTGAVVGGGYLGAGLYVWPKVTELVSAQDSAAGIAASALGGIALAVAGIYLERTCEVSPPGDGEGVR